MKSGVRGLSRHTLMIGQGFDFLVHLLSEASHFSYFCICSRMHASLHTRAFARVRLLIDVDMMRARNCECNESLGSSCHSNVNTYPGKRISSDLIPPNPLDFEHAREKSILRKWRRGMMQEDCAWICPRPHFVELWTEPEWKSRYSSSKKKGIPD